MTERNPTRLFKGVIIMSTYYGISSTSASTLFSSLSSTSSSSSVSSGSTILSQYASIKNGSYKKLLTAYYEKYGTDSSSSDSSTTTKQLAIAKNDASDLAESAEALYSSGTDSVFNKKAVTTTDETTGSTTTSYEYDIDSIYDAVKQFVDDYNSVLDSSEDVDNTSILTAAANMTTATSANATMLGQIGITIGSDNTLSIDEETFKSADINDIKSLFSGTGTYAYLIATKASTIQYAANSAISSASSTYSSTGDYSSLDTGSLYDSLF